MIEILFFSFEIFLKYSILYFLLFFTGRSFILIIEFLYFKNRKVPDSLLKIKSGILFPIIGIFTVSNLLIFLNFFIPLKSPLIFLILIFFNLGNILQINKTNLKEFINLNNFICYVVFPSILLISSSDINFHYDAGYYHLNHQNWLRESNLIIGMVNIFWAFGMSSVYEYISAILWVDKSFLLLHFLSLIFIHFFYLFLYFNILSSKNYRLKNASIFLLIFSILDNFGMGGGRNGFLYIQGVGKQDIAVAVLFLFISLIIISYIVEGDITERDFILISLITFFIFELKISTIFVYIIFFFLIYDLINQNKFKFRKILYLLTPNIFIAIPWFIKSYLSTGCVVFPINFLCLNNFDWYVKGSTKDYETISTGASFSYIEYFISDEINFIDWFNSFFNSTTYGGFSTYYRQFYTNFLISFLVIYIIKKIFFNNENLNKKHNYFILFFLFSNLTYSIFFGPIPRYVIGLLCLAAALLGFYTNYPKFKFKSVYFIALLVISIFFVPRANSYISYLESPQVSLFDPTVISDLYEEVEIYVGWVRPDNGDRCFVNLKCTMHEEEIFLEKSKFFTTAYRQVKK